MPPIQNNLMELYKSMVGSTGASLPQVPVLGWFYKEFLQIAFSSSTSSCKWVDKSSGVHIKYKLFPTHKRIIKTHSPLPTTSPILVRLQLIQHEEGATCTAKPWAGGNFHRSCCWWFRNLATKAPFGCMKLTHKATAADGSGNPKQPPFGYFWSMS